MKDMTDFRFDEIVREKLDGYQIEVGDELWSGIEKKMIVARRRKFALRVSLISIASAACLFVGLFLNFNKNTNSPLDSKGSSDAIIAENVADELSVTDNNIEVVTSAGSTNKPSSVTNSAPVFAKAIKEPKNSEANPVATTPVVTTTETSPAAVTIVTPTQKEVVADNTSKSTQAKKEAPQNNELPDIRNMNFDSAIYSQESEEKKSIGSIDFFAGASSGVERPNNHHVHAKYAASITSDKNTLTIEQISKSVYSMPITFGVKGNIDINERFSVGIGLNYSYYETSFDSYVNKVGYSKTSNQLHYVGVAVDGYYTFLKLNKFNFYAKAGLAIDKGILQRYVYGSEEVRKGIAGLQASVNGGVGAEWRALPTFGVYFEPTAHYFFDTKQPISINTDQPFNFGIAAGVRFYLKK